MNIRNNLRPVENVFKKVRNKKSFRKQLSKIVKSLLTSI